MEIIINDANILIDLIKLDLIEEFIKLEFELKTTDFVYEELYEKQRESIQEFIDTNKLEIITTEKEEDFNGISQLLEKNNRS
jgi:rRNA-processing protein FCF1